MKAGGGDGGDGEEPPEERPTKLKKRYKLFPFSFLFLSSYVNRYLKLMIWFVRFTNSALCWKMQ